MRWFSIRWARAAASSLEPACTDMTKFSRLFVMLPRGVPSLLPCLYCSISLDVAGLSDTWYNARMLKHVIRMQMMVGSTRFFFSTISCVVQLLLYTYSSCDDRMQMRERRKLAGSKLCSMAAHYSAGGRAKHLISGDVGSLLYPSDELLLLVKEPCLTPCFGRLVSLRTSCNALRLSDACSIKRVASQEVLFGAQTHEPW